MSQSTKVTMIGLGDMGSALAAAAVGAGHEVTVWNRTAAKTLPLAEQGARVASTVAEAVTASDLIIVCLRGYHATTELLDATEVAPALTGKTIVQLGTGAPTEVGEAALFDTANRALSAALEANHGTNIAAVFETLRKPD